MERMRINRRRPFIFRPRYGIGAFITAALAVMVCCFSYGAESRLSAGPPSENRLTPKEKKKTVKTYLKKAAAYYKKAQYTRALACWSNVLLMEPDNRRAKKGVKLARAKVDKIEAFFGKNAFGDSADGYKLTLEDCLSMAEETSILIQVAKREITLAGMEIWEARRAFLPSLTLSWSESKGIQDNGKIEGLEYGVEGKQPAFHSGELLYGLAQSKVNMEAAEKNYDKVKSELSFDVKEAYYSLIKAEKFLEYSRGIYKEAEPLYKMARGKYKKSLVSDIEYLNSESKFNKVYYKSIAAKSDFEIAQLALAQELNVERPGDIEITPETREFSADKDVNTCLSLAMENRPELLIKELNAKSAEYGNKIARAKEMPYVDLEGHYKKSSEVYHKDFSVLGVNEQALDPRRKWYMGLEVVWPFLGSTASYSLYKREDPPTLSTYDAGSESKGASWQLKVFDNLGQFSESEKAAIEAARAEREMIETRKKVIMEVRETFYNYEKARIQLAAAEAQKKFREKEVKILKAKHDLGDVEMSEVFESFVSLLESGEAYFEAEKALAISIAALNKAIGLRDYF